MRPLLITAHLQSGLSAADRWSPALDGILAYYHLREKLGTKDFYLSLAMGEQTRVDDLPLEKVLHGDDWWYAASSPQLDSQLQIQRKFYKKFNIDTSMLIQRKTKTIELTKSQFKNYSLSFKESPAKAIQWHVIGDELEIKRLLNQCHQVGAHRGKGMGLVTHWEVAEGDAEQARYSRPIPAAVAESRGIQGIKAWRGYRPSVRLACNQALCVLPF